MDQFKTDWEQLYRDEFMPWDTKRPDSHLIEVVQNFPIKPCRALDVGCGTGTHAVWLTRQGFDVTAIDYSETALKLARDKADAAHCDFRLVDVMKEPLPGTDYRFVFDLGCFHAFDEAQERRLLAEKICACLEEGGLWLTVSGSCDGPEMGPPRVSAADIVTAAEPYFEILFLQATELDELQEEDREALGLSPATRIRAWSCLMRKRPPEALEEL